MTYQPLQPGQTLAAAGGEDGEVLEVISNDPGTKEDIPLWAKKVGHEFLGFLPADGFERIFVVRKK